MADYQTPGVYVEELSNLGSSVVAVDTAVPGFVGYTEKAPALNTPVAVTSWMDYEEKFGGPYKEAFRLEEQDDGSVVILDTTNLSDYRLYYQMQLYFANGGGRCYVVSVGLYRESLLPPDEGEIFVEDLTAGLTALEKANDLTLVAIPEAMVLKDVGSIDIPGLQEEIKSKKGKQQDAKEEGIVTWSDERNGLYEAMLNQCGKFKDRFALLDGPKTKNAINIEAFRRLAPQEGNLKYGAAYFPKLQTDMQYSYTEIRSTIILYVAPAVKTSPTLDDTPVILSSIKDSNPDSYRRAIAVIEDYIANNPLQLSPSTAIAGVYAQVDNARGVWKAPANVALQQVTGPTIPLTDAEQENFNIDAVNGKSINAIRSFAARGTVVWGARTLDGNSNDWRYVSVRRLFIMVETSIKNAMQPFVFEPNTASTWTRAETQITSFLTDLWGQGAMTGSTTEEAFYVKVGLGETMTENDIQNGDMIIEVGIAPSRPAEFIVLRFSQKLQNTQG